MLKLNIKEKKIKVVKKVLIAQAGAIKTYYTKENNNKLYTTKKEIVYSC